MPRQPRQPSHITLNFEPGSVRNLYVYGEEGKETPVGYGPRIDQYAPPPAQWFPSPASCHIANGLCIETREHDCQHPLSASRPGPPAPPPPSRMIPCFAHVPPPPPPPELLGVLGPESAASMLPNPDSVQTYELDRLSVNDPRQSDSPESLGPTDNGNSFGGNLTLADLHSIVTKARSQLESAMQALKNMGEKDETLGQRTKGNELTFEKGGKGEVSRNMCLGRSLMDIRCFPPI